MGMRDIGSIVMDGDAQTAPVYLPLSGVSPAWSGKAASDLNKALVEQITEFATDEAWRMGYEDFRAGREDRPNPFHRVFLHGVPHAMFAMFYRRGIKAGCLESVGRDISGLLAVA